MSPPRRGRFSIWTGLVSSRAISAAVWRMAHCLASVRLIKDPASPQGRTQKRIGHCGC